jgi:PAS domain S-box-containing protein
MTEHMKLFTPESWERLSTSLDETSRTGMPYELELETVKENGSKGWMWVRGEPVRDAAGKIIGLWGAAQDITERKLLEAERRRSEEEHKHILKTAMDGFCLVSLTGKLIEVNETYCQMSGYGKHELLTMSLMDIEANEDASGVAAHLEKVLQKGEDRFESVHRRKDGTTYDVEVSAQYSAIDGGRFIAFLRDITERKQSEKALWESTERFKKVFNSQLDAILVLTSDSPPRVIECNTSSTKVFGYAPETLKGETTEILHVDDSHRRRFQDVLYASIQQEGHLSGFEFFMKRKDGTLFPSEHSVFELKNNSGERTGWVSIVRDLTERKALEKSLIKAQKMESIGNLAGGVAHDFNNLLSPIIGLSQLLLDELPKDSHQSETIKEILKAGKRGSDLVKQILMFSRYSEQKMIPTPIKNVIKEVLKLCRSTIPTNIEIHQDIQRDCGLVMADPTNMHQVAMNIITNAYHAVEENGGRISAKLKESLLDAEDSDDAALVPGQYAVLSVSDTGHGISPDLMEKIFEPYFTTKEKGKGTGLGLAVAHRIIKEHRGTIKVDSEIGKGTTIKVFLPLMKKPNNPEAIDFAENLTGGNEKILLVDDDDAVLNSEKQMLEKLGYKVESRLHSLGALEAFKRNPYDVDLVLTDMSMPHMTGVQLAKAIMSIRSDIPIIICTGFSRNIDEERIDSLGIKGLLMKPVTSTKLAQMVRKVLDEAKGEVQQ